MVGNLDIKTRAELSQYDTAPLDSNKLGIYFSPQTMINEDIIAQLGFVSLDDYIGDPGDVNDKSKASAHTRARVRKSVGFKAVIATTCEISE